MFPFVQQQRKYCSDKATQSPYCQLAVVYTLEKHPTASAIAISADSKILVSGGQDKAIKVWDLQTGELKKTLQSDSGPINTIAIAPDGKTVVSGSSDRVVRIWDLTSDQRPQTLTGHSGSVTHVDISSDGKTIISLDRGRASEIKVWDIATGKQKAALPYHHFDDISPDGKTVLFTSPSSQLMAWDVATNQQKLLQKSFSPSDLARISLDGQTLVTIQRANKRVFSVQVSELTTGELQAKERFKRRILTAIDLAVSRNVIIGSTQKGLAVWNLQTAELEAILNQENFNQKNLRHLIVSPDGKLLAGITGNSDKGNIKIKVLQRP